MLLEAFRLAEKTNNRDYQSRLAIELAGYYGVHELGMLDKAFHFSMHSLKVREGEVSERLYHLFMANAFDNVGRKDSADYHRQIRDIAEVIELCVVKNEIRGGIIDYQ